MVRKVQSLDGGVKVKAEHAYVIEDDEQEAKLLRGSIEYLDSAMETTAIGISVWEQRKQWIQLFEKTLGDALTFVDLLIIRQVKRAVGEDHRVLHGLLYQRARAGKPTVVDDGDAIKDSLHLFEEIVVVAS
jgi:hypothetical protein